MGDLADARRRPSSQDEATRGAVAETAPRDARERTRTRPLASMS
jgi:hypothetical protein